MKHPPFNARCVFIDGPVAVYVSLATESEILEAYTRLERLVKVAASQLSSPESPCQLSSPMTDD